MSATMSASDETPPEGKRKANRGGGRPKGSRGKAVIAREKFARDALSSAMSEGMSPLDIMILGARHPSKVSDKRFKRAEACAPYFHPKLSAVAFQRLPDSDGTIDLSQCTAEELAVLRKIVKQRDAAKQVEGPVIDADPEQEDEA